MPFYLKHLPIHTSLSMNPIVSSLAAGRPINVLPDIFIQRQVNYRFTYLHKKGSTKWVIVPR